MSKAEERALEAFPDYKIIGDRYVTQKNERSAYKAGYNQAEKDLELTWEDIMFIHKCIKDAMNYHISSFGSYEGQQKIYEDVLKRFKAQKI